MNLREQGGRQKHQFPKFLVGKIEIVGTAAQGLVRLRKQPIAAERVVEKGPRMQQCSGHATLRNRADRLAEHNLAAFQRIARLAIVGQIVSQVIAQDDHAVWRLRSHCAIGPQLVGGTPAAQSEGPDTHVGAPRIQKVTMALANVHERASQERVAEHQHARRTGFERVLEPEIVGNMKLPALGRMESLEKDSVWRLGSAKDR